jgi:Ig-like domain from next to BRCA1 gene
MKMHSRIMGLTALMLLATVLMAACNLPLTKSSGQPPALIFTSAAKTVAVIQTQFAATSPAESVTPVAPATPSSTPVVSSSPSVSGCDRASLIAETVPDGTTMARGTAFTKTWTLKNTGACTWNASYSLIFVKGDSMGGEPHTLPFTSVAPGEIIQVSVDLQAPLSGDSARGYWMLRNASGVLFGLGSKGDQTFWVQIKLTN